MMFIIPTITPVLQATKEGLKSSSLVGGNTEGHRCAIVFLKNFAYTSNFGPMAMIQASAQWRRCGLGVSSCGH
jgi:hypothetical protein